jgi:hypothetical protein
VIKALLAKFTGASADTKMVAPLPDADVSELPIKLKA